MTVDRGARRIDSGRLVMVPLAVLAIVVNGTNLIHDLGGPLGLLATARALGIVLTVAFYAMIVVAYLRRRRATATSRSVPAALAAVVATALPFCFPLLANHGRGLTTVAVADVLLVSGLAWCVWSVRTLGRSLSVLAQARGLVSTGPYSLVRHPLYLGELVAALGIVVRGFTMLGFGAWLLLVALQAYRARREEDLLVGSVTGYQTYRDRTALLIPGLL